MLPKIFSLLLLVGGIVTAGFGLFTVNVAAIVLGFSLLVLAYLGDRRRERRHKEKLSIEIAQRIAELTQKPWHADETLKLHGGLSLAIGVMLTALASAYAVRTGIASEPTGWQWVLGGAFFLALSVLALPIILAGVGQPLLELDRDGFKMPIHGWIPWHAVSGIDLHQVTGRGTTTSLLYFRIAHYEKVVANVHWSQRALAVLRLGAIARGVVATRLPASKEHPEAVYGVARFLWKQATGHDHAWNSMLSDEYNDAARRLATTRSRLPGPDDIENPEAALAELEQASKDFAVIGAERARESSRLRWLIGIAMLVMVVSIAWPWLNRP